MKGLIKQLQLGNYVGVGNPKDNIAVKVDAIHNGKIGYHKTPDMLEWVRANQLYPLGITKSFLDGVYEHFDYNTTVGFHFYHVATGINLIYNETNNEVRISHCMLTCKYLHQLQNLINFAFDNLKD